MSIQKIHLLGDRSGSMNAKIVDTIGGINSCIQETKKSLEKDSDTTQIKISLSLFDHEIIHLWEQLDINNVPELKKEEYIARGQTALLDAIFEIISKYKTEKEENNSAFTSCLIYVSTDGLENASRKVTRPALKSLIQEVDEKFNIKILYLGANQDAILEAASIGIPLDQAINFDETYDNITAVYRSVSDTATRFRHGENLSFLPSERQASQDNYNNQNNCSPPPIRRSSGLGRDQANMNNISIPIEKQHKFLDAAKAGYWDIVREMLIADINLINVTGGHTNRWSALHQAAYQNNLEMVNYLVLNGANKLLKNSDGYLPCNVTHLPEIAAILS